MTQNFLTWAEIVARGSAVPRRWRAVLLAIPVRSRGAWERVLAEVLSGAMEAMHVWVEGVRERVVWVRVVVEWGAAWGVAVL